LVTRVLQLGDFIPHQQSGLAELDPAAGLAFDDSPVALACDFRFPVAQHLAGEVELFEVGDALFEARLVRLFPAEKHKILLYGQPLPPPFRIHRLGWSRSGSELPKAELRTTTPAPSRPGPRADRRSGSRTASGQS